MTAAAVIAVFGATPLAIGVLIFQAPAGWESALGRCALLLAEIIAIVTSVVLGTRIIRLGQPDGKVPACSRLGSVPSWLHRAAGRPAYRDQGMVTRRRGRACLPGCPHPGGKLVYPACRFFKMPT
jgi:hypothetical protein